MYNREEECIILDSKKLNTYDIDNISTMLEQGRIVVFPTETVYGMACNGCNIESVKKIYHIKRREYEKPMMILIGNMGDLYKYIDIVEENTKKLIEKFWPGPLSLILKKSNLIPDYITNGSDKVCIRYTSNKVAQLIINKCDFPVVVTSANISNYENCQKLEQIVAQFKMNVDLYIEGGPIERNIPSTIVEVDKNEIKLIREGVIKEEEIYKCIQL
ncbi:MAG TPA: threonylcarbamoyl-AMP synthase [Clostridiales bacterium]|nr:MAG: threonylcarbamoyl-AMP synthase [Clostridiales bacterium GWD2_32_59]HAN09093.1 threonylcarbamoyl-AMP synthase [Clostridiales bacterium]